ncbi:MAG: DMT family transporter [Actinomycetota bacterium]|nr:DMT family transporter [Actinomycetota bacterium]
MLVLAAALLWGTTGTAQALGPAEVSPAAVGAARIAVGGAALLGFAWAQGTLVGERSYPLAPTSLAAVAVAAYQPLFFGAVRLSGVAVGTVVAIGSAPVLAGALGFAVRGERPGGRWGLATVLAVGGTALLLVPQQGQQGAIEGTTVPGGVPVGVPVGAPAGVLLALGAGGAYAVYAVAAKQLLEGRPPTAVMAVVFGLAALLLLPLLAAADLGPLLRPRGLLMILHLGVVATALAYVLFGKGLQRVPVASAATLSLAEPLTAGLLGVALLGERLTPLPLLGVLMVLAGLGLLSVRPADHTERHGDPAGGDHRHRFLRRRGRT